ncbi:SGNH/GDSL hydrolase family protein [Pseudobdellovibrio exovorus]|uniref:Uncharacterized protein n=1 Tax=Pseudobdellovibrio exovorus JSS TaxID=1184267 RepID=M4VC38_9BACT|nr:GDSL-type esterase/lipase family protein [Pseudobdellovibrio exovorus]AGH96803.1 hypothetical protein A11Q_2587 [Pseudobdellovibrio exovorus JSS]
MLISQKCKILVTTTLVFLLFLAVLDPVVLALTEEPLLTPAQIKAESLEYEPSAFSRQRIKREKRLIHKDEGLWVQINSYGYRGAEIEEPKKKFRLVIYGGSTVFDPLVAVSWPEQLQKELEAKGLPIEVINAGIPGASSAEITARFLSEVEFLKPDAVLLYEAWNDIRFFNKSAPQLPFIPSFQEQRNVYIYPANKVDEFLSEHSYLYLLARYKFLDIYFSEDNKNAIENRRANYGNDEMYGAEIKEDFKNQIKINYEAFVQIAKSAGVTPILATQAMLPVKHLKDEDRKKVNYRFVELNFDGILKASQLIQNEIRQVAKSRQLILVDADKDLSGRTEIFYDHVHFNGKGSEDFAHYMGTQLEKPLRNLSKSVRLK